MPSNAEWAISILLPIPLTWYASYFLQNDAESSSKPPSYTLFFLLYLFLDASYSQLFHTLLLTPTRYVARLLPGAKVPPWDREEEWRKQEEQSNDDSIVWPSEEALTKLPGDWIAKRHDNNFNCKMDVPTADGGRTQKKRAKRDNKDKQYMNTNQFNSKQTQPYFLNHVRGSTRIRQASQRVSAALGTVSSTLILCSFASSFLTLKDIGLDTASKNVLFDLSCGFLIGAFVVSFVFVVELALGWVKVIGYFDTVSPEEIFLVNFTWDILFHVGVSINEEIMLRGWMFTLSARGVQTTATEWFSDRVMADTTIAIVTSILLQSTFFSMMHYHSPGSTFISLVNLFIGGIAASFNFLIADGTLWLGIGWHFGWNIMMGHVLGRSTSGIPMSCSVINAVPKPLISTSDSIKNGMDETTNTHKSYERFHGGTFGPEQGPIGPIAYLMGMCMVGYIYGLDGLFANKSFV